MSKQNDQFHRPPPFIINNNNQQSNSTLAPEHFYGRERPIPLSFCESSQKYKPQSNSIAGGNLINDLRDQLEC